MINYFQKKYALSLSGSGDLLRAILWTIIMDISFMAPVIIGVKFLEEYIQLHFNADFVLKNTMTYYIVISLVLFLVMLFIAYIQYNATYTKIYEESAKRRISLAETLRKLPLAFFGKKDISDLSATIMDDATQIEMLFSHSIPQIYAAVLTVCLMAVMMFLYNWRMSLAVFWVVPVAALVFYLSRKFQNRVHRELYGIKREISDQIQEGLDLAHEIKSYNREDHYSARLSELLDSLEDQLIKGELLIGACINLSYVFLKLGLPTVILYGAYLLSQGAISIFTYLVFMIVTARIYNPIMEVMDHFALLIYLNVRIDRMKEMDKMPRQDGKTEFNPQHFDIEFKNVDFAYEDGMKILNGVSFTAKQGHVTALVGPSGGGKSTIAKLAARFWDAKKGCVTLGGQDLSSVDPEILMQYYAIVFQDVTLFNSSIMENIRLGRKDATDEEVIQAAHLAQCDEFVKKLPHGYDTSIGENGEKLSGGERQRISIARAILKDAPIILLDEATASLDAENESKIQSALGELVRNKTVLIIAHRMRTVLGADKIVAVKEGVIAETGTPDELKAKEGLFSSMLRTQYES